MSIRVRFAPSPTGWLHVGGVRTALINYLFAKKNHGSFILRVEDTDSKRGNEVYLKQQLQDLQWLGLQWDEGPDPNTLQDCGTKGPYSQSHRLSLYQEYAQQLIQLGKAYYCFLTDEEIQEIKDYAIKNKKPFRVISPYRNISIQEINKKIKENTPYVVRFKTPEVKKNYVFQDIVRGKICFPSDMVGDFVLLRSSGFPVYNFCCAVDDHMMDITHVFRSEEHLANTLRQLMIFEALSWTAPHFGHLSIILGEDSKKLSKRHGAVSCSEYKKQGYLPAALINFLALLGWNPKTKEEIFSITDLIELFSTEGLNSAPAIFDHKKLEWINSKHLQKLDDLALWKELEPFFKMEALEFPESESWKKRAVQALRVSITTLSLATELFRPLAKNYFQVHDSAKEVLQWLSSLAVLKEWESFLENEQQSELSAEWFALICKKIQEKVQVKGKFLFMPLRVAILGKPQGAELKLVIPLIRREVLLERVKSLEY